MTPIKNHFVVAFGGRKHHYSFDSMRWARMKSSEEIKVNRKVA